MGISSSRVKVDRAWHDIGKSSEEQLQHQRNLSCFRCGSIYRPRRLRHTRSSATDTGSMLSAKNSCTAPSQQTMHSDTSLKSDETEEPLSVRRGDGDVTVSTRLRRFTYVDLKLATRSFRSHSLLGEGGFGCVYKGWIDENGRASVKPRTGLTVAVKTLNHGGLQGHKEWLAEVTYLGQLHHPNLVKLIGYCIEDDKRLLVYEFMQRGSLENHLFRKRASPLSWNTRMKIALGAARGVEFLHTRDKPVIYRDLKTSNILLDGDYTAKLSDFGLAKDGPQGDKSHVSTTVMGTYGYAAPEYVMTGHLSSKSDIYSFGVVLLELLTGKRSVDKTRPNGEQNLAAWARPYLNGRARLLDIIDSRLERNYSLQGILKAGHLACLCLSRDPKVRPSMRTIVEVLEQIQEMKDPASSTGALPISTAGKIGQPASTVNVENMGRRSLGRSLR